MLFWVSTGASFSVGRQCPGTSQWRCRSWWECLSLWLWSAQRELSCKPQPLQENTKGCNNEQRYQEKTEFQLKLTEGRHVLNLLSDWMTTINVMKSDIFLLSSCLFWFTGLIVVEFQWVTMLLLGYSEYWLSCAHCELSNFSFLVCSAQHTACLFNTSASHDRWQCPVSSCVQRVCKGFIDASGTLSILCIGLLCKVAITHTRVDENWNERSHPRIDSLHR